MIFIQCSGQAGQADKAKLLLAKAKKIEEDELGARPERMVEIYYLTAFIDDEVCIISLFGLTLEFLLTLTAMLCPFLLEIELANTFTININS